MQNQPTDASLREPSTVSPFFSHTTRALASHRHPQTNPNQPTATLASPYHPSPSPRFPSPQLGQDNLEHIKAIADNLQGAPGAAPAVEEEDDEGDDGIPDLVDNFEEAA